MAVQYHQLGFSSSYEIEVDPEFPPSGNWGLTEIRVGGRSADTLVIKVSPKEGEPWVGHFGYEGHNLVVGVFGCPHPEHLLVVTGIEAYLLLVSQPGDLVEVPVHPITAVGRPDGTDLIVVGSFNVLAAIDKGGLLWVTDGLFHDGLELATGPPGKVHVQGWVGFVSTDSEVLTIDPATGKVIAGNWESSHA